MNTCAREQAGGHFGAVRLGGQAGAHLLGAVLMMASPGLAEAQHKPVWSTATGAGTSSFHASSTAACVAQHAAFAPSAPGPIQAFPYHGQWNVHQCDWVTHVEGGPINPLPSLVFLECRDAQGNPKPYEMSLTASGICMPWLGLMNTRPSCEYAKGGRDNPAIGNPVLIRDGSKLQQNRDFATEDGRLFVDRTYRSIFRDAVTYPLPALGAQWRLGHEWAMDLNDDFGWNGKIVVTMPDLSSYVFTLNHGGGVTADDPLADVSLSFVNTYGPNVSTWDVQAGGGTFKLRTGDDEEVTFVTVVPPYASSGHRSAYPTNVKFRGGYEWDYTYGSDLRLDEITDSLGRSLQFGWREDPNADATTNTHPVAVSTITLPDGTTLRYSYEAHDGSRMSGAPADRLYLVERLDAAQTVVWSEEYHYEDPDLVSALTGITDSRGVRYATFDYDGLGRVTASEHAGGADAMTIAYSDSPDNQYAIRTVTNALGKETTYRFRRADVYWGGELSLEEVIGEPSANCIGTTRGIVYDTDGRRSVETDEEGNETGTTYHTDGRIATVTRAAGTPDAVETSIAWHSSLNRPVEIEAPGLTSEYSYDADGNLTAVIQTDTTTHTLPYPTNGETRSWTYTYTADGLPDVVDGPLAGTGDSVDYDYDSSGYLDQVTDALGHVTNVTGVNGSGQPTALTAPGGKDYTLAYDDLGRLTSVTADLGWAQRVTALEYDEIGQVTEVTLPDGSFLEYEYNAARRLVSVENNAGERIEYTHNLLGNVTEREVKASGGAIVETQSQTFDELGRLLASIGAAAQTWTHSYDGVGNLVSVEDPRENVFSTAYDGLNRLITLVDEENEVTALSRTPAGGLASLEDPNAVTTGYVRNGWDEVIRETSPDIGTVDSVRNALGLVTEKTDARGIVTQYSYDDAGRLTGIVYPASTGENVTFGYDDTAGGNLGLAQLTSVTDESGSTALTYDMRPGVAGIVTTIGTQSYTLGYDYDAAGRLAEITYPSGRQVSFWFDASGRPASIGTRASASDPWSDLATDIGVQPFSGTWTALLHGNGVNDWRVLDGDGRIEVHGVADGATDLRAQALGYQDGMNLTAQWDGLDPGRDEEYWYSPANRLQNASGPWGELEVHTDGAGNRRWHERTQGGVTTSDILDYATGSNRLEDVTTGGLTSRAFTHDAAGNILTDTKGGVTTTYSYNHAGRLASVTKGSAVGGPYLYNGFGQLASRGTPGGIVHMLYDLDGNLLAEADAATGDVLREYVWLEGRPVAVAEGVNTSSPEVLAVHVDHLDRPVMLTDASKAVVWEANYKPFGEVASITGPKALELRFPGQVFMLEAGLAYNWHRWYDASLGRYTQPDPLGLEAGLNRYVYAENSPLMFVDPTGEITLPDDPSGLPPDWERDPSHKDPKGSRWRNPEGGCLDFSPGEAGEPGYRGRPHWHDCTDKERRKKHWLPGEECPQPGDDAAFSPRPIPLTPLPGFRGAFPKGFSPRPLPGWLQPVW